ncbi:tRNA (adenosine(37)-N6)-threonylcarbamoyltransferase complex ATPase subunit type 1 TsaE [Pseudomonas moraviensis]|uniref:tRNA threonylcarbamoyladenosine biosynthesis protein TsaE n=2 Tax=Pseudomonas fluorescens group TaxID=136843 RepID=A0A423NK59_9PSED|nr:MULTISPECIES: tRNA (adenosine(37)-N6)-threonylcarbamoyltransferase complex ATPase subunit type 1 TsaE [Pseudomonas]KIP95109.1 ATPase [Pseudomonas fluorescens]KPG83165.1 ATPase [Pseudomonas sp. RIT-PI-o]MDR6164346.1 tRNA threonylcarbamoyladenosine biosynthesis protein TsaE [Pseudomonas fluorescens]PWB38189.1 tRNA (adenosine(37)-N6)-threonylcarbamoyltransferase complex ATPase subunit type 1 TsaE [Pseudomonas sp. NDM]RON98632.1 tRNA (adenosine(37)-N6)-threonylcarbamoyltransferase complex ATPas
MSEVTLYLADEQAMSDFGARIARVTQGHGLIFLEGNLGMGKTTLSRGIIRGLGHVGAVKSPTFTLVEPYEIGDIRAFHFDLYRLVDPEELEFLGIRDYFEDDAMCLIEWPDKGAGFLPKPDLTITIGPQDSGRSLKILAEGSRGEAWCAALALESN